MNEIEKWLRDSATHNSAKEAMRILLRADALDAVYDAKIIAELLRVRLDELLRRKHEKTY